MDSLKKKHANCPKIRPHLNAKYTLLYIYYFFTCFGHVLMRHPIYSSYDQASFSAILKLLKCKMISQVGAAQKSSRDRR